MIDINAKYLDAFPLTIDKKRPRYLGLTYAGGLSLRRYTLRRDQLGEINSASKPTKILTDFLPSSLPNLAEVTLQEIRLAFSFQ